MFFTDTKWWHAEQDTVVCDLCPRECRLHDGQRGFCFVRQNVDNQMALTTYGRSTGFCIDPIEKKPLNHFLPGTPVLSFGTAGCNLGCKFCQNWSISKAKEIELLSDTASPEAIAQAALNHGCRSVAFTYNDPVIWAEYAIDTAKACREVGIKTVAVTAGYITEHARSDFYRYIDAANVDLKAFTETFYKYITFSKLAPVLETLKWLKHESDVWFEITNLIIPGENDSPDELRKMCDWVVEHLGSDVPIHFSAFHPDFRMLDRGPTPPETLIQAHEIATQAGIQFAYVGNVHDCERQSTYCPQCKNLLIERDWYEIGVYRMQGDRCSHCGTAIPGVFEDRPGDWGQRRQPIRIMEVKPEPQAPSAQTKTTEPKVDFTEQESQAVARFIRQTVESIVGVGNTTATLPEDLANAPTFGAFVTAKRGRLLRACRGRWGNLTPLAEMLASVARDSVTSDPRFPSIEADELPFLNLQVSLMYDPQTIRATGGDRVHAVRVREHGLVLNHPSGRGLLLPQVAVEQGWDAETFLEHLSLKAGLDRRAWKDESANIMTFRARLINSPPPMEELDAHALSGDALLQLVQTLQRRLRGEAVDQSNLPEELLHRRPERLGIFFALASGKTGLAVGKNRTVCELVDIAVESIAEKLSGSDALASCSLLTHAIRLDPEDYPSRDRTIMQSAVLAVAPDCWSFAMPQPPSDPVARALSGVNRSVRDWQATAQPQLTAFSVTALPVQAKAAPETRPAARAGLFYPKNAEEMQWQVREYLKMGQGPEEEFRAILLPHAGWRFCGTVMGKTLANTLVPETAIIIGPKHTPYGPNASVTSADRWEIPGATIPIAAELRAKLLELVPALPCEPEAHRYEHGSEVLLPFLLAKNSALRVLPIVLGPCSFEDTTFLAKALHEVCLTAAKPPLLVISSDMNHFAAEPENRRRDLMALDAMLTGDARRLYDTCKQNEISMCGMLAAVTVMQVLRMDGTPMPIELVDYTNSGMVTGDTSRVVGYAGVTLQ